ncbi:uncharacterized protein MKK02DRAFT_44648 [Dioszegia hungarica]|uniref:GATA-type domain-containing protein n=1 Tax=Dioszegia hungarica TaxID=4972 RepID=A0AA38HBL0_9TREE|nr:uncharacterized protein MKK02DRAFT_44648 [Dioszegia hungarica]KAI9635949.1 hypothetical protein MKK02DRAFT_44648 [Dioszegia hungarica]
MAPTKSKKKAASKAGRRPVPGRCINCGCSHLETTQWRYDESGDYGRGRKRMCSACGLYRKNNGKQRRVTGGSSGSPSDAEYPEQSSSDSATSPPSSSSRASASSQGYGAPVFVSSPESYDSPLPSSDLDERVLLRFKLTLGSSASLDDICPERAALSPHFEEQSIVLQSDAERWEAALDVEEDGEDEARRAAEALLEIAGRGESEAPLSPFVAAPAVPEAPVPAKWGKWFRLIDTRPSHLFNRPQRPPTALLPPSVQRYAIASAISRSNGTTLPPIRAGTSTTIWLPPIRDLRLS